MVGQMLCTRTFELLVRGFALGLLKWLVRDYARGLLSGWSEVMH